jgi:hypothetical protein
MLHFSDNDTSSVLVVKFVRLVWNVSEYVFCKAVVLTKPKGVHDGQQRLFIYPAIAYLQVKSLLSAFNQGKYFQQTDLHRKRWKIHSLGVTYGVRC